MSLSGRTEADSERRARYRKFFLEAVSKLPPIKVVERSGDEDRGPVLPVY